MSNDSNKVYGIGDRVNVVLIDNKALSNVKYLGVDDRDFFVFEDLRQSNCIEYCVPESSIIFVEVEKS